MVQIDDSSRPIWVIIKDCASLSAKLDPNHVFLTLNYNLVFL